MKLSCLVVSCYGKIVSLLLNLVRSDHSKIHIRVALILGSVEFCPRQIPLTPNKGHPNAYMSSIQKMNDD